MAFQLTEPEFLVGAPKNHRLLFQDFESKTIPECRLRLVRIFGEAKAKAAVINTGGHRRRAGSSKFYFTENCFASFLPIGFGGER